MARKLILDEVQIYRDRVRIHTIGIAPWILASGPGPENPLPAYHIHPKLQLSLRSPKHSL